MIENCLLTQFICRNKPTPVLLLQSRFLHTAIYHYSLDKFKFSGLILEENDLKIKTAYGRFLITESTREGITKLIELGGKDDRQIITTMPFSRKYEIEADFNKNTFIVKYLKKNK
jgi:hypothetical protein